MNGRSSESMTIGTLAPRCLRRKPDVGPCPGSGSRRDVGCTFIRQRFRRRKGLVYVVAGCRNLPLLFAICSKRARVQITLMCLCCSFCFVTHDVRSIERR